MHLGLSAEFRREAVRLVLHTDKTAAQVARDLNVNPKTLGNWGPLRARRDGPTGRWPRFARGLRPCPRRCAGHAGVGLDGTKEIHHPESVEPTRGGGAAAAVDSASLKPSLLCGASTRSTCGTGRRTAGCGARPFIDFTARSSSFSASAFLPRSHWCSASDCTSRASVNPSNAETRPYSLGSGAMAASKRRTASSGSAASATTTRVPFFTSIRLNVRAASRASAAWMCRTATGSLSAWRSVASRSRSRTSGWRRLPP